MKPKLACQGPVRFWNTEIPMIFIRPYEELLQESSTYKRVNVQVPVIDLSEIRKPDRRKLVVEEVRIASATWGFFQVINHGVSIACS